MCNADGCWYCGREEGEDMLFSSDFDTFVHISCARSAYNKDKDDVEARIIAKGIGIV